MKKIFFSLAIMASGFTIHAQVGKADQKPFTFSIGVEAGLPVGYFKDGSSFGIGSSVQGEYAAADMVGLTLSAGYLYFNGKSGNSIYGGTDKFPSTSIVPVLAGVKIFVAEKIYFHGKAGASFFNHGDGTVFTYAPEIGFLVSKNIDISVKYQAASKHRITLSFIGLRAAYSF